MARKGNLGRNGYTKAVIKPAVEAVRKAFGIFDGCENPGKKKEEKNKDELVLDSVELTIVMKFHRIQEEKPRKIKKPWKHCRKPRRECVRAGEKGKPKHPKYRFRRGGNGARIRS